MNILSNIGPNYSLFVLTFHATELTARTWKMPNLVEFMESLTQEQDKLVIMGNINLPKTKIWLLEIQEWIQKARKNLKIHLSKRETSQSLKRIPKAPRRTPRRRRRKEKMSKCASAHTTVRDIIMRALL